MNLVKYVCVFVAIVAFASAFHALPVAALTLQEAEKETEKLLARLADKKLDGLAEKMESDEFFGQVAGGYWGRLFTALKQEYLLLGSDVPVYGFEKIGQKKMGSVLISNRYAVLVGTQPLLLDIWLYKPDKDWRFLNLTIATDRDAVQLLKAWFASAN